MPNDYVEINEDFLNYPEGLEKIDGELKLSKIDDDDSADNLALE